VETRRERAIVGSKTRRWKAGLEKLVSKQQPMRNRSADTFDHADRCDPMNEWRGSKGN